MNPEIPDFDRIDAAAAQLGQANNVIPIVGEGEPAADEPQMSTAELLVPILGIGFGALAPNWKITGDEIKQLSDAYGALIDKYLPDTGLEKFGAEISAVMVTAMIIMPRASIPRKQKKKISKPEAEKNIEIKMDDLKDAS